MPALNVNVFVVTPVTVNVNPSGVAVRDVPSGKTVVVTPTCSEAQEKRRSARVTLSPTSKPCAVFVVAVEIPVEFV
jgi:hypothetical protein